MKHIQPIYTAVNWLIILFLFPHGTLTHGAYVVLIDDEQEDFERKVRTVRKISPYLANMLEGHGVDGVIFTKELRHERRNRPDSASSPLERAGLDCGSWLL